MAETDTATEGAGNFLTRKVGPLPMYAWLAAGILIYYYFSKRQAAASSASAPNQQTDPAGNIGSIDPATGYVYGTPEDTAALAANNSGSTGDTSASSTGTGGAQKYADNNAWGIAAVNYLVGLGIDAVTANQAVQNYLSSQQLTTAQQGDINLAIGALGPPPTLPGPTGGNPPPVTVPPGGGPPPNPPPEGKCKPGWHFVASGIRPGMGTLVRGAYLVQGGMCVPDKPGGGGGGGGGGGTGGGHKSVPPPTGLAVSHKSARSVAVKWNRVTGATGYHVAEYPLGKSKGAHNDRNVGASTTSATFGGLEPGGKYVIDVWAEPTGGATGTGPHATVTVTLPTR